MEVFKIDTEAISEYAIKLERINRSAMPVAIRKTLNLTALDVKKVTMPEQTSRDFIKRKPTFFSAVSRVEFAQGFDVNSMAAVVGFTAPTDVKESGHATKDLEEQEEGGTIDKRAFIATAAGRTAKGNVRDALTMRRIKPHIIDSMKMTGRATGHRTSVSLTHAQRFIIAAIKAGQSNITGAYVIGTDRRPDGSRALLKINSIKRIKGRTVVNSKEIYTVKAHRQAHVKATHFMLTASMESARKMRAIFIEQSEIAFAKVLKS